MLLFVCFVEDENSHFPSVLVALGDHRRVHLSVPGLLPVQVNSIIIVGADFLAGSPRPNFDAPLAETVFSEKSWLDLAM